LPLRREERPGPSRARQGEATIELSVEPGLHADWDEPRVTELVRSIVRRERPTERSWVLGLHLVSDETIRQLNAAHRGRATPTDVLSFPLDASSEADFVLPARVPTHLGDVVISYPRAVDQAEQFGHSVDREIGYLVAHGVLHVLGYDHEDRAEREIMRSREEEALQPLGYTR
jgi:probable rRNA maturation factor